MKNHPLSTNCPIESGAEEILLDYAARRLDPIRSRTLESHVAGCPRCAEYGRRQQAVWDVLDTWEAEPVSLDFQRRIWERIEKEDRRWLAGVNWRPAVPLALTAMFFILWNRPATTPAGPSVTAEGVAAEQVERAMEDLDMLAQLPPPAR